MKMVGRPMEQLTARKPRKQNLSRRTASKEW